MFGRDIRWSDEPELEERALETVTVSDLGVAFTLAQTEILGGSSEQTSLPAVYRSVSLISDLGASLPLEAIGRNGVAEPFPPPILEHPNPAETYNTTLRKIFTSLLFRGNAYLWARTRDSIGNITSAYVLNPDEVSVAWDRAELYPLYSWRDRPMEVNREIFPISINHWPGRLKGVGPIEAARLMFSGMRSEARMARRIFEDEATPTGILKVPRALTKPEAEEVQEMWEESHAGRKRPAVLSGGVEFDPITINPVDAQFIEQRNFSIQEVARLFGLPGYFLLVPSGDPLTYSTTEGLMRIFLTTTLNPTYLEPVEEVFSLMLPEGITARFNAAELLRADTQTRYAAYQAGLAAGFLTIDEVRATEHLPGIEPSTIRPREATNAGE
jgi:HK97 family phage portal protein